MNAGGKKAVLWGTALDNLASWRMVTPDARVARGHAPRPQPRQDPRRARSRRFELRRLRRRRHDRDARARRSRFPARTFRKAGLGKDVTDKFLAGLPGVQKEGCDGLITSRALHPAPDAARRCAPCASSSSAQVRDSTPAIVEIKHYRRRARRSAATRACMLAGLEHLDERYVKAVGYATKAKRHGRPKMVLLGDIVGDDDDAVARGRVRGRAHRQRARRRGLRRGLGGGAQEILARPRAHRGDREAHQRVQDQRGRRHSARRASATTPTASSASTSSCRSATSSRSCDALRGVLRRACRSRKRGRPARRRCGRRAEQHRREGRRGARADRRAVRARWQDLLDRHRRRRFRRCRTTRVVVSWKARARRRRSTRSSPGSPSRRCSTRCTAIHATVLREPRVRRAAHARRRRQRAHQHPGQLRRLRDAAARPTRRWRASWRSRGALGGVISGEHGIGITKLEYLTPRRDRALRALQARRSIPKGASTAASCCARRATSPTPTRRASRCSATRA